MNTTRIILSNEFTYVVDDSEADLLSIVADGNYAVHSTNRYTIIIKNSHIKTIGFYGDLKGISIILDNSIIDLIDMTTYNEYKLTLNNRSYIGLILANGIVAKMKFSSKSCKIHHMICFSTKRVPYHMMNAIQNFASIYSFTASGRFITSHMKNAKYSLIYNDKVVFLKTGKYFCMYQHGSKYGFFDLDSGLKKEILTTLSINNI